MTSVWADLLVGESYVLAGYKSVAKGISTTKMESYQASAGPASLLPPADLGNRDGGLGAAASQSSSGWWSQDGCTLQRAPQLALCSEEPKQGDSSHGTKAHS